MHLKNKQARKAGGRAGERSRLVAGTQVNFLRVLNMYRYFRPNSPGYGSQDHPLLTPRWPLFFFPSLLSILTSDIFMAGLSDFGSASTDYPICFLIFCLSPLQCGWPLPAGAVLRLAEIFLFLFICFLTGAFYVSAPKVRQP